MVDRKLNNSYDTVKRCMTSCSRRHISDYITFIINELLAQHALFTINLAEQAVRAGIMFGDTITQIFINVSAVVLSFMVRLGKTARHE